MARKGPRPDRWITGTDPLTHAQYRAWLQQRNQAQWRREPWTVTFEQLQTVWAGRWDQRGRGKQQLMMTRIDPQAAWCWNNIQVVTREQHGQRQADLRVAGYRSSARARVLSLNASDI